MSSQSDKRFAALQQFVAADPGDAFSRYALALEYRSRDAQYLALYYALGGLYADLGDQRRARDIYSTGISIARAQNETHAMSELEEALGGISDFGQRSSD